MGFDIKKLVFSTVLWMLSGLFSMVLANGGACSDNHLGLRGDWGQAQFLVEIVDDAAERAQGLMFREEMDRMAGMLFIYESPQNVAFWMKNTLLPLDMIFIDATGAVTAIHENAIPGDLTPIPGGDGVLLVLEVNAGLVATLGVSVGSQVQHPSIDQKNAAWACAVQ